MTRSARIWLPTLTAGLFLSFSVSAVAQEDDSARVGVLVGLSGLGAQIGQWMLEGA